MAPMDPFIPELVNTFPPQNVTTASPQDSHLLSDWILKKRSGSQALT